MCEEERIHFHVGAILYVHVQTDAERRYRDPRRLQDPCMVGEMKFFYIVDMDGFNVFLKGPGCRMTYLEFQSFEDALNVVEHWSRWLEGEDV
jgi:hypothetical protein